MAVAEAAGATEALDTLRRAQRPFDLAIIDAQMPDTDGFGLAAAVQDDPRLAATPLLSRHLRRTAGRRRAFPPARHSGLSQQTHRAQRPARDRGAGAHTSRQGGGPAPALEVITRHTIAESRRAFRILLAEDNPVNQQVAATMLRKRGHQVDIVGDGAQAIAAVQAHTYDLVLMDVQMPVMDGLAATAGIRALPQGRDVPIVAVTAHALAGDRERCLAAGMTGYLTKPFKAQDLFAVIEASVMSVPASPATLAVPPAPDSPVDLEGFRATMREADAEDTVDAILATFVTALPGFLASLTAAVAAQDAPRIQRAAHNLKSAAGSIGAAGLATLLANMETAALAGDVARGRGYRASPAGSRCRAGPAGKTVAYDQPLCRSHADRVPSLRRRVRHARHDRDAAIPEGVRVRRGPDPAVPGGVRIPARPQRVVRHGPDVGDRVLGRAHVQSDHGARPVPDYSVLRQPAAIRNEIDRGQQRRLPALVSVSLVWSIGLVAFAATYGATTGFNDQWIRNYSVLMRYLIGFPAALLSAVAFVMEARSSEITALRSPSIARDMKRMAVVFAIYAVLAGLIVPDASFLPGSIVNHTAFLAAVGIPIQVFRAACAVAIAMLGNRILRIFEVESSHRLESAQRTLTAANEGLEARVLLRTGELTIARDGAEAANRAKSSSWRT